MGAIWAVLVIGLAAAGAARAQTGAEPFSLPLRPAGGGAEAAAGAPGAGVAVVVEYFTSQGCPACPPVDAFFAELADRPGIVALALHVDYWDYMGWADLFARPEFTARQKAYARAAGARMVYTPQIIVQGSAHVAGNRPVQVMDLIERHRDRPPELELSVARSGLRLEIRAERPGEGGQAPAPALLAEASARALPPPAPGAGAEVLVQLVRYRPTATVTIERGENAGRTVTYRNIVTDWRVIGRWDGQGRFRAEAEAPSPGQGEERAVVILQEDGPGPILAAAPVP